jgi:hypothetical protein
MEAILMFFGFIIFIAFIGFRGHCYRKWVKQNQGPWGGNPHRSDNWWV